VKVDDDLPLETAVLVGCGVPTGWGSAVYAAGVSPGDTVVIYGIGGIGINSVQGAAHAGASNVVAVDPLPMKRERAEELGATHSFDSAEQAQEAIQQLTRGVGADQAIITVDVVNDEVVAAAFGAIRKGGTVVITGLADPTKHTVQLSGTEMTLFQKTVKGTLFGASNPMYDIPKLLGMYQAGQLKLDELVTQTYTLDQLNEGYDDLLAGKNIRGVLLHAAA
jgi:Zn-dependent alcohol dehydrogenase